MSIKNEYIEDNLFCFIINHSKMETEKKQVLQPNTVIAVNSDISIVKIEQPKQAGIRVFFTYTYDKKNKTVHIKKCKNGTDSFDVEYHNVVCKNNVVMSLLDPSKSTTFGNFIKIGTLDVAGAFWPNENI